MSSDILPPVDHEDFDDMEERATELMDYSFSTQASLRYLANEHKRVMFTDGERMDLSFPKEDEEGCITRVKVMDYQKDRKVARISRIKWSEFEERFGEYMKSEVFDTFEEAAGWIQNETEIDPLYLQDTDMAFDVREYDGDGETRP